MFVVFDLDGTLANIDARVDQYLICPARGYPHKRAEADIDWDSFHLDCAQDEPIPHALEVLRALYSAGHHVQIWTGRGAIARADTIQWLLMHGVPHEVADEDLIMRPIGDHRNDDEMKRDWIAHYGKPDLVFEDRNRVVNMWRNMGVPCFHVAPGDF